ncbi:transcriptional regulator, ArsR family [Segniliparus rotundus DSM 44985]|uniref:Transcriptional regulator, ArsR family n=1 Tax=Segniliparus rotundus (strain ATCC BAA-972 / CDC 1076 / CIP 108378 / DSM 44985 / JCM 13578) TaxID=640132 RepID=D6Z8J9_SEGRD|nr:transcriptional regulator, ArsR family [Segniliparus rotundus DSM 44985]
MRVDDQALAESDLLAPIADPVDDAEPHVGNRTAPEPAPLPEKAVLNNAGDILRALAAPVRIAIVLRLRGAPHCVHELVDMLGLPQPLVSQHLRVLREQRVVAVERSGREAMYRLADQHLAEIVVAAISHAEEVRP